MNTTPIIRLVAACARGGVIGLNNTLPWHLPADLKHFKAITTGKPVVMGRKTYESIGRPLPNRDNIVLTRQADWQAEGVRVVTSLSEALTVATSAAEICIIGGGELYQQAISIATHLSLTEIDADFVGDAHFPVVSATLWQEISRERHFNEAGPWHYDFVEYQRR